jgi:poly(3-hydroxybutyrate) depolymerase
MWSFLLLAVPLTFAREFSVSGYSGGAFMAVQMHFAFSKDIISASVFAGGPYYCSAASYEGTLICMNQPDKIPMASIYEFIKTQEDLGTIDSTSNLKSSSAFIFTGTKDSVVIPGVGKLAYELYKKYIDAERVFGEFSIEAEHVWPTDGLGGDCLEIGWGIGDCDYDGAEKVFKTAYGELKPKVEMIRSNLRSFDQRDYVSDLTAAVMAEKGYIYVPNNCQNGVSSCRVHVSFHACEMNYDDAGDYYIAYTGLNEWAEGNDIIVIYPQVSGDRTEEVDACWDYWGYTREDFALKSALQMKAAYDMAQNPPVGEADDDKASFMILVVGVLASLTI